MDWKATRPSFWGCLRYLIVGYSLIPGLLLVHPVAFAETRGKPEQIRVLRVPDTWETKANDDSIYFERGSSLISDLAGELIRRHAAKLRAKPSLQITLIAHTGDLGSSSLELARGQNRLAAVRKRLVDLKVPPSRIRLENQGSENRNAEPCADEECRSRYGRVDVLFGK